jgi:hypothetical protein
LGQWRLGVGRQGDGEPSIYRGEGLRAVAQGFKLAISKSRFDSVLPLGITSFLTLFINYLLWFIAHGRESKVGTTRGWSQQVERGAMVERTGDTVEWHALLTTSVKGVGRGSGLGDQEQLGRAKGGLG